MLPLTKDITILCCSWKSPKLLEVFIPALLKTFTLNNQLLMVLNEADKESIDICYKNGVEFVVCKENLGTLAVDMAAPLIRGKYVQIANDDFYYCPNWDVDIIDLIEKNYPCSASCFLVEPRASGNGIVYVDDLGDFFQAGPQFLENCKNGKYKGVMVQKVNYYHPITVRTEDFMKVGGYGNSEWAFTPGYCADDAYPFRLWKLHNEKFKFITSCNSMVYHGMSLTNNKLGEAERKKPHHLHFEKLFGMTIPEFNRKIGRNIPTELVYGAFGFL